MKPKTHKYNRLLKKAVKQFWNTRKSQASSNKSGSQGNRGAVTGGKQLDGFIDILRQVSIDLGVPASCIYTKGNVIPGYYRATKDWDFVIISPKNNLIALVEFKSQVGSFGNNFNNRSEEAIGSAVDFWASLREKTFTQIQPPWVGYLLLVEDNKKSNSSVSVKEPYFNVRPEFRNTSYLERYGILCKRLIQERHYSSTSLITTKGANNASCPVQELSFENFILSFMGFINGKVKEFE